MAGGMEIWVSGRQGVTFRIKWRTSVNIFWHIRVAVWCCGNLSPCQCLARYSFATPKAPPLEAFATVARSSVCAIRMVPSPAAYQSTDACAVLRDLSGASLLQSRRSDTFCLRTISPRDLSVSSDKSKDCPQVAVCVAFVWVRGAQHPLHLNRALES